MSASTDTTDTHDGEGLSAIRTALARPFDGSMIQRRKVGGGREVDYVSGSAVISRLNAATGDAGWSMRITERWVQTLDVTRWNNDLKHNEMVERDCMCVAVELTVPGLGTRPGIGVQILEPGAGEDPLKGALTDATKNAAKQFGVALELYGRIEDEIGGQSATQEIPAHPAYERSSAPSVGGQGSGPLEPTDRQRKLIDVLRSQLSLSDAELNDICKDATGYPFDDRIGRKSASSLIDKLQELKGQGHRGGGAGNPTSASAPSSSPPSSGTAGTGATDDVTVKLLVKAIEGAKSVVQLNRMESTLKETGLINNLSVATALATQKSSITGLPSDEAGDIPF